MTEILKEAEDEEKRKAALEALAAAERAAAEATPQKAGAEGAPPGLLPPPIGGPDAKAYINAGQAGIDAAAGMTTEQRFGKGTFNSSPCVSTQMCFLSGWTYSDSSVSGHEYPIRLVCTVWRVSPCNYNQIGD